LVFVCATEFICESITVDASGLKIIFDCGVDDFLIEPNRDFHQKLLENGTTHDYTERPGGHTWEYWENALPYQMVFFHKV
jgi:enterochelin esterase-like enzyme